MSVRRTASIGDKVAVLLRSALQDERLSFRARGVLVSVLSRPMDWQTSAARLARQSPTEGRDALKTALIELETCGYLRRRRWQNEAGQWVWSWDITDDPTQTPADEPQVSPQVTDIPAGQTMDGSTVDGSSELGPPDLGPADSGSAPPITGGSPSGGSPSGSRRNPPRPPDGALLGAAGNVLDTELPLYAPDTVERLVEIYATAYLRAGGHCTTQTRSVVARSCKRLLTVDGVPEDALAAACEAAGGRRSKDIDSRIERPKAPVRPTMDPSKLTPNVSPDDPQAFAAEQRALIERAAAGTLDVEAYLGGTIIYSQGIGVSQ
jgi:hypothetical protein